MQVQKAPAPASTSQVCCAPCLLQTLVLHLPWHDHGLSSAEAGNRMCTLGPESGSLSWGHTRPNRESGYGRQ